MRAVLLVTLLAHQGAVASPGLELLRSWLAAVEEHEPGVRDPSVDRLSAWTAQEFDLVLPYVRGWLELAREPSRSTLSRPQRRFSDAEISAMRAAASETATRGGPNRVLKLAAQLHADVVVLPSPAGVRPPPPPLAPGRWRQSRPDDALERRLVVRAPDGRMDGIEPGPMHWDFARTLLDQITPDPAADPWVARWYRASAAAEAGAFAYAEAGPLLTHARKILPSDALIFFASGCHFESLASPAVQDFVAATVLPGGLRFDVESAAGNLGHAQAYFQYALGLDPTLVEARIRLARVMSRLGRTDEAAAALDLVLESPPASPALHFLAAMFLAEIEQGRGRDDRALPLVEKAASLYPHAQSAHMALAHLARRRGETEHAFLLLRRVIARPSDRPDDEDPWWHYARGEGPRAEALLAEVRAAVAAERGR